MGFEYLTSLNPILLIPVLLGVASFAVFKVVKLWRSPRSRTKGKTDEAEKTEDETKEEPEGKLTAYVWHKAGGIKIEKIVEPIGRPWFAEATMPKKGVCYLLKEDDGGNLVPYDPRDIYLEADESPGALHDDIRWPEVKLVYVNTATVWEKLNMILPYGVAAGAILVVMMGFDKIGK